MPIEKDLIKLNWRPHTCSCDLTYWKEVTVRLPPETRPFETGMAAALRKKYAGFVGWLRVHVEDDDRISLHTPSFETTIEELGRGAFTHIHGLDEMVGTPGTRVRARVTMACTRHLKFLRDSAMRMQLAQVPSVCSCIWKELWYEDDAADSGWSFFGHRMQNLCLDHAELVAEGATALGEIPALIHAAVKHREGRVALRIDRLDRGELALVVVDENGAEHRLLMPKVSA